MKQVANKPFTLSAVDMDILQYVKLYHYVTCEQIVHLRYSPNSLPTCQLRLKALFEAGYLLRTRLPSLTVGATSYVYHISTKAQQLLEDTDSDTIQRIRRDDIAELSYPFLAHCLALNDVLIAASLLPHSVPAITLAEMRHDLDLKRTPIRVNVPDNKLRTKINVVPDAWLDFRMEVPGRAKPRRKCLVIELDRGTTSITPLKQKLRALYTMAVSEEYQALFGTDLCQVAYCTTAGTDRLSQLKRWCEEELAENGLESENGLYLFAALPDVVYDPQELFCSEMWYRPFVSESMPLLWPLNS